MIIGRAGLKTIVAGQFGLNWYAIDRRCRRPGQGGNLRSGCGVPPQRFSRFVIPAQAGVTGEPAAPARYSGRSRARWMALNTWLGKNGLGRKPSGCAARARSVVWASISPERKIAGTANFSRSWQASAIPLIGPVRRISTGVRAGEFSD